MPGGLRGKLHTVKTTIDDLAFCNLHVRSPRPDTNLRGKVADENCRYPLAAKAPERFGTVMAIEDHLRCDIDVDGVAENATALDLGHKLLDVGLDYMLVGPENSDRYEPNTCKATHP